jgi:uncharacterized protein (TIGR02246 family)
MQDNKSILTQANEAIAAGDYEEFLSFCTEDTEWHFVGEQVLKGKDAVRKYIADNYREPPRFKVEKMIADGAMLAVLGTISIKDKDGKFKDHEYCDVWEFRDGKMAGLKAFVIG